LANSLINRTNTNRYDSVLSTTDRGGYDRLDYFLYTFFLYILFIIKYIRIGNNLLVQEKDEAIAYY